MHYSFNELEGRAIGGTDGEVGKLVDLYLEDQHWTVRHLVVETGNWFDSRQVLISTASLVEDQPQSDVVKTRLTREEIKKSPSVDTKKPVSRQYETEHAAYYGYPMYWTGGGLWGGSTMPLTPGMFPRGREPTLAEETKLARERSQQDSHLRSIAEIIGYHIEASDGEIGHVEEFLIDPKSWQIQRLLIDTRNWLPGKHVQLDPGHIRDVDWRERKVRVDLSREQVRSAPEAPA